jgi:hypothetical protein
LRVIVWLRPLKVLFPDKDLPLRVLSHVWHFI